MDKVKVHDGIVGAVVLLASVLGYTVNTSWCLVPIVIGVLMVQSAFTGFCPVYFILNKVMKS